MSLVIETGRQQKAFKAKEKEYDARNGMPKPRKKRLHSQMKTSLFSRFLPPRDDRSSLSSIINSFRGDVVDISDKFKNQLILLAEQPVDIENNKVLQERVKKGCAYFAEKVKGIVQKGVGDLSIDIDNKVVRKSFTD